VQQFEDKNMSQGTHQSFIQGLLRRGLTTNSTEGDFLIPVPTDIEPVSIDSASDPTANSFVVGCGGSETIIYPFGTDADNEAFGMRVYLWSKAAGRSGSPTDLWVPYFVGGFVVTLSSALNGVAGALISDLEFMADTITEEATNTWDDGYVPPTVRVRSFAAEQLAEIRILTNGYQKLEVRFDNTTAATANALFRQM